MLFSLTRLPCVRHIPIMTSQPNANADSSSEARPLSPAQTEELATAMQRAVKILGAAKVAALTGWTVGACGVLTLLLTLFSPAGVLLGGALVVVAWNELEGRRQILKFDAGGPRRLARNQLWLLAIIVVYCLAAIFKARFYPAPGLSELETLLELGEGFVAGAATAGYALVLAVGAAFQWGMYRYHAARIGLLEEYVRETPAWILEVQRIVRGG